MDEKDEDLKIGVHSQHARILKEEDEVWISSEDLNTENSSEDDGTGAKTFNSKRKVKQKNRKRSTPNMQFEKVPDYRAAIFPNFLKKPEINKTRPITPDSEDDFALPPISCTSAAKLSDVEDWRPMKGALSSRQDESELHFHQRKLLSTSKQSSATKPPDEAAKSLETFKPQKNTSEIKDTLKFIANLEDKIDNAIAMYKVERTERISVEREMCKEICLNKRMHERDVSTFLNLCVATEPTESCISDIKVSVSDVGIQEQYAIKINKEPRNEYFIKRNNRAAQEGIMAGSCLTDEEKSKIAQLLDDIDNFELADSVINSEREEIGDSRVEDVTANAFKISFNERRRIDEINNKLKEFTSTKMEAKTRAAISDNDFWKQYTREKTLKDIDAQLEKLYQSFKEDDANLSK